MHLASWLRSVVWCYSLVAFVSMAAGIKLYDWLAVHTWQSTFLQPPLLQHQTIETALVGVKCVGDNYNSIQFYFKNKNKQTNCCKYNK